MKDNEKKQFKEPVLLKGSWRANYFHHFHNSNNKALPKPNLIPLIILTTSAQSGPEHAMPWTPMPPCIYPHWNSSSAALLPPLPPASGDLPGSPLGMSVTAGGLPDHLLRRTE